MAALHSSTRREPVAVLLLFCCAASCMSTPQSLGGMLTNQGTSQGVKSGEGQFQRRLVVQNDKKAMTTRIEDSYVLRNLDGDVLMQQGAGPVGANTATGDLSNTFDADRGPRNEQFSEEETGEAEVMSRSARQGESVGLNFKHGGGGRRRNNDYSEDTGTGSGATRDTGTGSGTATGTGTGTGTGSGTAPSRRRRRPGNRRRGTAGGGRRGDDGTRLNFSFNKGREIAADEGDYVDTPDVEETPVVRRVSRKEGERSLFVRSDDVGSPSEYDSSEDTHTGKTTQRKTGIAILEPTMHGKSFQIRRVGWSTAVGANRDGVPQEQIGNVRQGRKLSESRSSTQFKSVNGNRRMSTKQPSISSRFLRSL